MIGQIQENHNLVKLNIDTKTDKEFYKLFCTKIFLLIIIMISIELVPLKYDNYQTIDQYEKCTFNNSNVCKNQNEFQSFIFKQQLKIDHFNLILLYDIRLYQGQLFENLRRFNVKSEILIYDIINEKDINLRQNMSQDLQFECKRKRCQVQKMIKDITYEQNILVLINLKQGEKLLQKNQIRRFNLMTFSESFTEYLIITKYIFLFLSIQAFIIYKDNLKKINKNDRVIEQKMIHSLSIILILFNDPFYAIGFYYPNGFSKFLSTFFQVIFIVYLMFFWIIILERISRENKQKYSQAYTKFKKILMFFTIVVTMVYYMGQQQKQNISLEKRNLVFIYAAILYSIIAIIILVNLTMIVKQFSSKLQRYQNFLLLSLFFCVMNFFYLYEANLYYLPNLEKSFLYLVAMQNLYVFLLQYSYSVSQEGIQENQQFYIEAENRSHVNHFYENLETIDNQNNDIQDIDLNIANNVQEINQDQQFNQQQEQQQDEEQNQENQQARQQQQNI